MARPSEQIRAIGRQWEQLWEVARSGLITARRPLLQGPGLLSQKVMEPTQQAVPFLSGNPRMTHTLYSRGIYAGLVVYLYNTSCLCLVKDKDCVGYLRSDST